MKCPDNIDLMNYLLGRKQERELRLHLARCRRCQDKMQRLDRDLQQEALVLQDQSHAFHLRKNGDQQQAV